MVRKFAFAIALATVAGLTIGCDAASTKKADPTKAVAVAVEKGKDAVADAKVAADKVAETVKADTLKPIMEKMDAIKAAAAKLTGDAGMKATTGVADLGKMVDAFKAAPLDKIKDLAKPLSDKFAEVMKMVGM